MYRCNDLVRLWLVSKRVMIFLTLALFAAPQGFAVAATAQSTEIPRALGAPLVGLTLPQEITDANANVTFDVDSTWHLVHGVTSGISGKVWFTKPAESQSVLSSAQQLVQAEIHFPVANFNTDSTRRDARMREVMHTEKYPEVQVRISSVSFGCLGALQHSETCPVQLASVLSIAGTAKELDIPAQIERTANNHYRVSGKLSVRWADYGVDDPSIIVAKLDPVVTVSFSLEL